MKLVKLLLALLVKASCFYLIRTEQLESSVLEIWSLDKVAISQYIAQENSLKSVPEVKKSCLFQNQLRAYSTEFQVLVTFTQEAHLLLEICEDSVESFHISIPEPQISTLLYFIRLAVLQRPSGKIKVLVPGKLNLCSWTCAKCIESSCHQCLSGYFLNTHSICEESKDRQLISSCTCSAGCLNRTLDMQSICVTCSSFYCKMCLINPARTGLMFDYGFCMSTGGSCFTNCYICQDSGCSSCYENYINQNGVCVYGTFDTCSRVNPYCKNCDTNYNCLSCESGYYFLYGSCVDCAENCSGCFLNCETCTSSYCSQCKSGFARDSAGNCACVSKQCKDCFPDCLTCNSTSCIQCNKGYDGNSSLLGCYNCSDLKEDCEVCRMDLRACLTCVSGKYLNTTDLSCSPCSDFDSECRNCNMTGCTECPNGLYVSNGTCEICSDQWPNCLSCTSLGCTNCSSPYLLNNGSCGTCETIFGPSCVNCNSTNCKSCFSGLFLADNKCVDCETFNPRCENCTVKGECLECEIGYILNGTTCSTCVSLFSENCTKCADNQCVECVSGMFLGSQGKCMVCDEYNPNCAQCNSDGTCGKCKTSCSLVNGKCAKCPDNCLSCDFSGCLTCKKGYYSAQTICLICSDNCLSCDSNGNCLECQKSYRISNGNCLACIDSSISSASLDSSFTNIKIILKTSTDLTKQINCYSFISTNDSIGNGAICTLSNNLITVQLGSNFLLSVSSVLSLDMQLVFVNPCNDSVTLTGLTTAANLPVLSYSLDYPTYVSLSCGADSFYAKVKSIQGTLGQAVIYSWSGAADPADSNFTDFLKNQTADFISVPLTLFQLQPYQLTITSSATNSLKQTYTVTAKISLTIDQQLLVFLDSGQSIAIDPLVPFIISSSVTNDCNCVGPYNYSWTKDGVPVIGDSQILIPANNITVSSPSVYQVTVQCGPVSGSASVTVSAKKKDLIIVLSRSSGTISNSQDLVIDASGSFDPLNTGNLVFSWTCQNSDGSSCSSIIQDTSSSTLIIKSQDLGSGSSIEIQLELSNSLDSRKTSFSLDFAVAATGIDIKITTSSEVVRVNQWYIIQAFIDTNINYTVVWSQLQGPRVDLNNKALTSLSFAPGILQSGAGYKFRINVSQGGLIGQAEVSFKVNSITSCLTNFNIPFPMIAWKTYASIEVAQCTGENTPLSYLFYMRISNDLYYLNLKSQSSSINTTFIEGKYLVGVYVCDSLNDCASYYKEITVLPGSRVLSTADPLSLYKSLTQNTALVPLYSVSFIKTYPFTLDEYLFIFNSVDSYVSSHGNATNEGVQVMLSVQLEILKRNETDKMPLSSLEKIFNSVISKIQTYPNALSLDSLHASSEIVNFTLKKAQSSEHYMSYIVLCQDLLSSSLKVHSRFILPGQQIYKYSSEYFNLNWVKNTYFNLQNSLILTNDNSSLVIENLNTSSNTIINAKLNVFYNLRQGIVQAALTDSGSLSLNNISLIEEKPLNGSMSLAVTFNTPDPEIESYYCKVYQNDSWKNDHCLVNLVSPTQTKIKSDTAAYFTLFPQSSGLRYYPTAILTSCIILVLIIFYPILQWRESRSTKSHETQHVLKFHTLFGIFFDDMLFKRNHKLLHFFSILSTDCLISGLLLKFVFDSTTEEGAIFGAGIIGCIISKPLNCLSFSKYFFGRRFKFYESLFFVLFLLSSGLILWLSVVSDEKTDIMWVITIVVDIVSEVFLGFLILICFGRIRRKVLPATRISFDTVLSYPNEVIEKGEQKDLESAYVQKIQSSDEKEVFSRSQTARPISPTTEELKSIDNP